MAKMFMRMELRLKLAALWTSFMFLYIYVDYFALYMPGKTAGIMQGKVFVFDITGAFLLAALISVTIPALMIFFSLLLPDKLNRRVNIVAALVYIPYSLLNLAGEYWPHMVFGAIAEVFLLCWIIRYAWNWEKLIAMRKKEFGVSAEDL